MAAAIRERDEPAIALAVEDERLVKQRDGDEYIGGDVARPGGHVPAVAHEHLLLLGAVPRIGRSLPAYQRYPRLTPHQRGLSKMDAELPSSPTSESRWISTSSSVTLSTHSAAFQRSSGDV